MIFNFPRYSHSQLVPTTARKSAKYHESDKSRETTSTKTPIIPKERGYLSSRRRESAQIRELKQRGVAREISTPTLIQKNETSNRLLLSWEGGSSKKTTEEKEKKERRTAERRGSKEHICSKSRREERKKERNEH